MWSGLFRGRSAAIACRRGGSLIEGGGAPSRQEGVFGGVLAGEVCLWDAFYSWRVLAWDNGRDQDSDQPAKSLAQS